MNRPHIYDAAGLEDLVRQIDPQSTLSPEAAELLQNIAEKFIRDVTDSAIEDCKRRKSSVLEARDVHGVLARNYDLSLPGDTGISPLEDIHQNKPSSVYDEKLKAVRKAMEQRNEE